MEGSTPRIVITGTGSGCGKTTVTCAILQALVNRGLKVGAFKCGPDYIDPMFHSQIISGASHCLDPFFFSENTMNFLLQKGAQGRDISIIEGAMGYYDGLTMDSAACSTHEVALKTKSPAVLIVDAKGAAMSVLAVIHGFLTLLPESTVRGVILNGCTAMTYALLKDAILSRFGGRVLPFGFMPTLPDCSLESRHLGLVTAQEVEFLQEKLQILAQQAEKTLDLEGILSLASSAPEAAAQPILLPKEEPVRIGVAMDEAFCFYYADSLSFLEEMGAELVPFSPLAHRALPPELHGLYLGGGYPELYREKLSQNTAMAESIRSAVAQGLPTIAECGGFMYLTDAIEGSPMAGALPGNCFDTGALVRFGYVHLTAEKDNLLCKAGQSIPAHEFHHWECTQPGTDFRAEKPSGRSWPCAVATETLYAGFPHFHFYANPQFGIHFYRACVKEKHRYDCVY